MKYLFIAVLLASCTTEKDEIHVCSQCVQIVSDSATGAYITTKHGSPDPSKMYYCDGVLKIIKSQAPSYVRQTMKIHNTGIKEIDISYCQKYHYVCEE